MSSGKQSVHSHLSSTTSAFRLGSPLAQAYSLRSRQSPHSHAPVSGFIRVSRSSLAHADIMAWLHPPHLHEHCSAIARTCPSRTDATAAAGS